MSTEENKAIAHRWYTDVMNTHDLGPIDELFAAGYEDHSAQASSGRGIPSLKAHFAGVFAAFPDLQTSVQDIIAEGDKVVVRFTIGGTHSAEFMGVPATGKRGDVTGVDIFRFEGGKVVEHWAEVDFLGMLQQLGVLPRPGQGPAGA